MKVSIFGLGYVGCVTAGCLAKDGHQVIGVDVVAAKVKRLATGKSTVVETGLDQLIGEGHRAGLITATTNGSAAVDASDVSIICVGTPIGQDRSLELTALRQTVELIARVRRQKSGPHLVVLRSTVPPGTTESMLLPALATCPGDSEVVVVPEFLREGSAIADYYDPAIVVVGAAGGLADQNRREVEALFGKDGQKVQWVSYREAEMLKGVCNAFHAVKVAFANEVGALCSSLGIDAYALMEQFVRDTKLNISPAYLRPGLPFGGSCLPKDLRMLAQLGARAGVDLPLLDGTLASNEAHLKRTINAVPGNGRPRIGLDGLAFKPGTDDLRESPIVLIAEHLIGKGYDLRIYDPAIETSLLAGTNREYIEAHLPHLSSRLVHKLDELIDHADVVLLARDVEPALEQIALSGKHPTLIDLRGENHLPDKLREAQARVQARLNEPAPAEITGALPAKPAALLSVLGTNTRTNLAPSHAP